MDDGKENGNYYLGFRVWGIVPLKYIEDGVYGDLLITYPEPYSIYIRGTISNTLCFPSNHAFMGPLKNQERKMHNHPKP